MAENISKSDSLTDVNTVLDEGTTPYFTDVYTPGETKEQLIVGDEVATPGVFKGTIDTSTITTTTDNVYNFSVDDPSFEMFSIGVEGAGVYQEKTFYLQNTIPLAYELLETQLQDWLSPEYTITYVSGGNYTIQRLDKQELIMSNPNLVRNIELIDTNEHSLTDITVDGVTVQLDGSVQTTDALAITYLKSQLSSSLYYMNDSGNDLIIARKDAVVPVISSFKYDRYTYIARGSVFEWKWIYNCNDVDKDYQHYINIDGLNNSYTLTSGLTYDYISPITIPLLNTPLGNWSSSNCTAHGLKRVDMLYDLLTPSYTKGAMYQWDTWGAGDIEQEKYGFPFWKNDYSTVSLTGYGTEVIDASLNTQSSSLGFYLDTSTNNTTVNITTYTEITKTTTLTSNNYFIPVGIRYTKIEISAVSSNGSSEGIYELRGQSCTAKYSTTTIFVEDEIFRTDTNNYGNIVSVQRGGFIINFSTNTSNKLNFTCS